MNRSEDHIDITIRVGNSRDWTKITVGRSYYFNMKRGTLIKDLKKEFIEKFPEELKEELERYSIYTKKFIRLYDNNVVEDAFSEKDDSDLNIYDKDETMFYAVLMGV
jgi:hypothetical protein